MTQRNRLRTFILGEEYTIAGDHPPEKLARIAEHVERVVAELRRVMPAASSKRLAVLAALNLAEECLLLKEKAADEGVAERVERLVGLLPEDSVGDP